MQKSPLLIMNTCPTMELAENIANSLIDQRLAACVNIIPGLTSIYRWKGQRESGNEYLLLIKARADNYQQIEDAIKAVHPYELAEIIAVSIETGLAAYLAWIDNTDE